MQQFNSSICLIIKDENEYINEWLEWHIRIGFEHFFIYDNESKVPIQKSVNKDSERQRCKPVNAVGNSAGSPVDNSIECSEIHKSKECNKENCLIFVKDINSGIRQKHK